MSDLRSTWDTYAASWKVESAEDKRALFEVALAVDCVYTDPLTQRRGYEELLDYMQQFHDQIPGGHFHTIEFFAHHDRSVARWEMRGANEEVLGAGISYGEYNSNGNLIAMTGFFEPPGQ